MALIIVFTVYGQLYNALASQRGFEPPTCRLGGGRSILLSYCDIFYIIQLFRLIFKYIIAFCEKPPKIILKICMCKPTSVRWILG